MCPKCEEPLFFYDVGSHKVVGCNKCGVALKLETINCADEEHYFQAFFDYQLTGESIGIWTNAHKSGLKEVQAITLKEVEELLSEYKEKRRNKRAPSEELIESVWAVVQELKRFTAQDIAEKLNLPDRVVRRAIRMLRDEGKVAEVERIGARKIWELQSTNF